MNPFIPLLMEEDNDHEVEIFKNPEKSTKSCAWEWGRFGTCCELESLKKYNIEDQKDISKAVNTTNKMLTKYATYMYGMLYASKYHFTSEIKLKSKKSTLVAKAFRNSRMWKLKSAVRTILNKPIFERNSEQCWKEMSRIRANALCSVCSGRSSVFFSEDKILIHRNTCSRLLNSCAATFSTFVKFFVGMEEMTLRLREEIKSPKEVSDFIHLLEKIERVTKSIRKHHIQVLILSYLGLTTSRLLPLAKAAVASKLCSQLISIKEEPFIKQLSDLLDDYQLEILSTVTKEIRDSRWLYKKLTREDRKRIRTIDRQAIKEERKKLALKAAAEKKRKREEKARRKVCKKPASNYKKRLLNFAVESGSSTPNAALIFSEVELERDLFVGDVKVMNSVDSAYTSFIGATGSNHNEASTLMRHIPVNMTNEFP
jgi:hypothetical protein